MVAIVGVALSLYGSGAFLLRLARIVRLLRIARLGHFSVALERILTAISSRRFELNISVAAAVLLIFISSTMLYVLEGAGQPEEFGSIPRAMWWAVATLTTVGYGDAYPVTGLGRFFASLTAFSGVGLIAMPAGILASALSEAIQDGKTGYD